MGYRLICGFVSRHMPTHNAAVYTKLQGNSIPLLHYKRTGTINSWLIG